MAREGYEQLWDDVKDTGLSIFSSLYSFYENHKEGISRGLWWGGVGVMVIGFALALAPISPMLIGPGIALSILESVASLSTFMFASLVGGLFATGFSMLFASSTIYQIAQQEEALEKSECEKLDTRFTGKENLILQRQKEQKTLQKQYDEVAKATGQQAKQAKLRQPTEEEIAAADRRLAKLEDERLAKAGKK